MRYTIIGIVNYIDKEVQDISTLRCNDFDVDNISAWITQLIINENDATSFVITIVPQRRSVA